MPRKIHQNNYTIIELLLVILVIGIMLGIGVGGIDRAIRGSGATGGIRNIGSRLTVARSFAVSSNQKVAVVFPMIVRATVGASTQTMDPLSGLSEELRNKYLFRAVRVCVVTWETDRYVFQRWCENDEWTYLPGGTCCNFYFDDTSSDNTPALIFGVDMHPDGTLTNPGPLTPAVAMPGIVYSAGGGLDSNMGTPDIKIVVFEDKFNAGIGTRGTFMIHSMQPQNADSKIDKGWTYNLNPFTGLGTYDKTGK